MKKKYKHLEAVLYPEDGWDAQKIEQEIQRRTSVDKYVIALHDQDKKEDGTPKKAHYHVYLHFGNNTAWACEAVAQWFSTQANNISHIQSDSNGMNSKNAMYYTLEYYTHSHYPDKHHYQPENFTANFDVADYLRTKREEQKTRTMKQNRQTVLQEIIQKIEDGTIRRYNYTEYISPFIYAQYKPQIDRAFEHQSAKYSYDHNGRRNIQTMWLYGESGTGKTTMASFLASKFKIQPYLTHPGNDPFDSYMDQPAVILDDIRPDSPFQYSELLKILDPFYMSGVHSRYKDELLKVDWIFVTSVFSPEDFYKNCSLENRGIDTGFQLYRRLSNAIKITENSIFIQEYDKLKNGFQTIEERKNPVPGYVTQQNITKQTPVNIVPIIDKILSEIQPTP